METSRTTLTYTEVEGKDIQDIIWGRLMPAVEGARIDHTIISMLAFAVLLMKPDVPLDDLKVAVQSATEAMALSLVPVPKDQAN